MDFIQQPLSLIFHKEGYDDNMMAWFGGRNEAIKLKGRRSERDINILKEFLSLS
jgi:hypothetical protein